MDYKNGKIYSIRSHQTDKIYIGSTTQSLSKRFSYHKRDYKKYITSPEKYPFTTSFEIFKFGDAYIELIEEYPCDNKEQLCKKEGELIRNNNCVNKCVSGRTMDEWRIENKNYIQKYSKEYYEKNKNKIQEYKLKSREKCFSCECGGCYTEQNKSRHLKTGKHQKYLEQNL